MVILLTTINNRAICDLLARGIAQMYANSNDELSRETLVDVEHVRPCVGSTLSRADWAAGGGARRPRCPRNRTAPVSSGVECFV